MTEMTSTSTYGATEQTLARPSLVPGHSFELYDPDDDEEYEYLPLPEVDEDYLDDGVANGRKERTFQRLSISTRDLWSRIRLGLGLT